MYFLGIFHIVAADPKAIVAARVPSPKAGGSELIFADKSQPPPPPKETSNLLPAAPPAEACRLHILQNSGKGLHNVGGVELTDCYFLTILV